MVHERWTNLVNYPLIYETPAVAYGANRLHKLQGSIALCDISVATCLQRVFHHLQRVMLAKENDLRL